MLCMFRVLCKKRKKKSLLYPGESTRIVLNALELHVQFVRAFSPKGESENSKLPEPRITSGVDGKEKTTTPSEEHNRSTDNKWHHWPDI